MSDAATLGILRDLFGIASVALVLGLALYAVMRVGGGPQWNCDGNVLSRPYGWPDAIVALLLLVFFVSGTAVGVADAAPQNEAGSHGGEISEMSMLVGMVLMLVIALMLVAYMRMRGLEPGEMFGVRQLPVGRAVLFGALAVVLAYGAMVVVRGLVQEGLFNGVWPDDSSQDSIKALRGSTGIIFKVLIGAAAVVIAPVGEEAIFRGFLYGVTKRYSDRWFAAIFTSLVFACVHHHVGSVVPLFTLAMGFAIAYEVTGCLLVPVTMHALFNGLNLVLLLMAPES
jgi:uncharacterized protein